MDPLSITASIVGISTTALDVTKALHDFRSSYKQASLTVTAICSESAIINASLSQIQSLMFRDGDKVVIKFQERPDLCTTFDIALTGCQLLFSCLEEEISELRAAIAASGELGRLDRMKAAWKEDAMVALLTQLRGQETALGLLLQGLQVDSVSDIQRLLQAHGTVLGQIEATAQSLRKAYPNTGVPESIIDTSRDPRSVFGEDDSTLNELEFSFDDSVVNSKAYRRAMAFAEAQIARKLDAVMDSAYESNDTALTMEDVDPKAPKIGSSTSEASGKQEPIMPSSTSDECAWRAPPEFHIAYLSLPAGRYTDPRHLPDWVDNFQIKKEDVAGRKRQEIALMYTYFDLLNKLRATLETYQLGMSEIAAPIIAARAAMVADPTTFVQRAFGMVSDFQKTLRDVLYMPLLGSWEANGAWNIVKPEIFMAYFEHMQLFGTAYACGLVNRFEFITTELKKSAEGRAHITLLQKGLSSHHMKLSDYLTKPITHIYELESSLVSLHKAAKAVCDTSTIQDLEEVLLRSRNLSMMCRVQQYDSLHQHEGSLPKHDDVPLPLNSEALNTLRRAMSPAILQRSLPAEFETSIIPSDEHEQDQGPP